MTLLANIQEIAPVLIVLLGLLITLFFALRLAAINDNLCQELEDLSLKAEAIEEELKIALSELATSRQNEQHLETEKAAAEAECRNFMKALGKSQAANSQAAIEYDALLQEKKAIAERLAAIEARETRRTDVRRKLASMATKNGRSK